MTALAKISKARASTARALSRAIAEALEEMDKTQWPTPTDYSDAEQGA